MDGFDVYDDWEDMEAAGWDMSGAYLYTQITSGRWPGGNSVRLYHSASVNAKISTTASGNEFGIQSAFKVEQRQTENFISVSNDGGVCFRLVLVSNGTLYLYDSNNSLVAQSSVWPSILDNTWHYLEVWATIDNSGHALVKVDGVTVLDEDLDTQNGTTNVDAVQIYSASDVSDKGTCWDDIVLMDAAGTRLNALIGDSRIDTLVPDADTAQEDFTCSSGSDSFALLDDTIPGDHDGDTSFIYSTTAGHKTRCELEAVSIAALAVHAIALVSVMKMTTGGHTVVAHGTIRSNGTDEDGTSRTLTVSYVPYRDIWELDPDGDVAWTEASVSALEVGVGLVSTTGAPVRVTRSCVEVLRATNAQQAIQIFMIT